MGLFSIKIIPKLPTESLPRSVTCLSSYDLRTFVSDLVAGITVGLVALPLAMAFAISSGLEPQAGIYCAIVAGFIISALGGSRVQIGGPTGAFVVVVSGIVIQHGVDGLFMCTMMSGVLLVILGLTGLGTAVKYIPRPVVVGFTNGIAVLIASTQIKDIFGLQLGVVPGEFTARIKALLEVRESASSASMFLSLLSVALVVLVVRTLPRVPGYIVALVVGTVLAGVLGLPVETVGSKFGDLPAGLPSLVIPSFRSDLILPLLAPTLTVTMLGAIESLLSAVVADRMSGDKHNPNVELFAQGVANIISPLVGGLPATGAIARTATNVRSGAKTPMAGMIHAITLLVILLVAAPLAKFVPLSVLAAILIVVSYNMGEWREIPEILRLGPAEIIVWLITFALTVMADLTVAVQAGMIFAVLLYIRNVTATTTVSRVTSEYIDRGIKHSLQLNKIPDQVAVYRIHGPFLFGATDKLATVEGDLPQLPRVVVLRLRNMTAIDATGLSAIEKLALKVRSSGREIVLCGMRDQPAEMMRRARFSHSIGEKNLQPNLESALERAREIVG